MGVGGNINLINGSPHNWIPSGVSSYQMDAWSWPTVQAGESKQVYVEWGTSGMTTDDAGDVSYTLDGTSESFNIQGRNNKLLPMYDFHLYVTLDKLQTRNNDLGEKIDSGFDHDGSVNLIISEDLEGNMWSNADPPIDWMQQSLSTIGNRKLKHICMPGSHDSGMSEYHPGTVGASYWNTQTQLLDMYNQLVYGARYFDLRPVLSKGAFVSGHYSEFQGAWFGGNGQSFDGIVRAVNDFTATNKELIILQLSHTLDSDNDYSPLAQDEWNRLFDQMKGIRDLYIADSGNIGDLTNLPLSNYLAPGKAAVLVVADIPSDISLGNYGREGIFSRGNFPLYDSYSNSNNGGNMQADQLRKLAENRNIVADGAARKDIFHVLSWTLTQQNPITEDAIVNLAVSVWNPLFTNGYNAFKPESFPNVLYMDAYACRDRAAKNPFANGPDDVPAYHDVTALAMSVNNAIASKNTYITGGGV